MAPISLRPTHGLLLRLIAGVFLWIDAGLAISQQPSIAGAIGGMALVQVEVMLALIVTIWAMVRAYLERMVILLLMSWFVFFCVYGLAIQQRFTTIRKSVDEALESFVLHPHGSLSYEVKGASVPSMPNPTCHISKTGAVAMLARVDYRVQCESGTFEIAAYIERGRITELWLH